MRFLANLKKLLGVGPSLIIVFAVFEVATVFINKWTGFPIHLSDKTQIAFTILFVVILLSGMAWFNFTLNLIKVNFKGGDRNLVIHGPFKYVRHPLYSTLIFTLPALILIWESDLLFLIPWAFIILVTHFIVIIEERSQVPICVYF